MSRALIEFSTQSYSLFGLGNICQFRGCKAAPVVCCPTIGEHHKVEVLFAFSVTAVEILPRIGYVTFYLGTKQHIAIHIISPRCLNLARLVHCRYSKLRPIFYGQAVVALNQEANFLICLGAVAVYVAVVCLHPQQHRFAVGGLQAVVLHKEHTLGKRRVTTEQHGAAHTLVYVVLVYCKACAACLHLLVEA